MKETTKHATALKQLVRENKLFLIITHLDPDGDALGAAAGLAFVLKKLKKQVVIGLCEPLPLRYDFLNRDESLRFVQFERINPNKFDSIISVDASSPERLGKFAQLVKNLPPDYPLVNIDHHSDNHLFGKLNVVDPGASSASQMIVELFGARALDKNSAWCLYAGIVYDTGSFRHGVNIKRAHEAAIACLNFPIDSRLVYNQLFSLETESALRLFARALTRLNQLERGRIVYISLTAEDYRELKADPDAAAGFISKLVMIEGSEVIVFFNEYENNRIKISLRSNTSLSVADFAAIYGGGGHLQAAGFKTEGILEKVIERTVRALKLALEAWDKRQVTG